MLLALIVLSAASSSGRQVIDLDRGWKYARVASAPSISTGQDRFDLSPTQMEQTKERELKSIQAKRWESAILPHAAWTRPLRTPEIWQGVTYYRRSLPRPAGTRNKLIELTIEAAMQSSDLWLNGKHVAARRGGYLPLSVDLTPWIQDENQLLVRVDNRDNPLIPPGKPQAELDFMYGNGIYRHARLTVTNPLHVTDPLLENIPRSGGHYVTYPLVSSTTAVVNVRTHVRNSSSKPIRFILKQSILDSTSYVYADKGIACELAPHTASQYFQVLHVYHQRVWSPSSPTLYHLKTRLLVGNSPVDSTDMSIGIRSVEVSRKTGFVLNSKPIRLIGTNRHQDYPWVGPALSDGANIRDALMIRRAGHNIVRLSHYPQSPAFLDACDRFGLMVIPCIPGWQFLNNDSRFVARVDQDIRELIRRDRNHPCTAFWEASLNETYPSAATAKHWNDVAKSESVDDCILTSGDAAHGARWDVAYNQWKEDLSRPQDDAPDRPGYIREYGDYEFGGDSSSSRVRIGEGMDKLLQETWNHVWSLDKFRPQYPWTMGAGTWEMFDTNVPWKYSVSACGLVDLLRRPKPSFWFFASQESPRPMLKISATWQPGLPKRSVVVFTNCEQAKLSLNGDLISSQKPTFGLPTPYDRAKPFDGSNTANLTHPPIVFRDVPFIAGTLKVAGYVNGKKVAEDVVSTAGAPIRLKIWLDDLGVQPLSNDLVFVRAAIVDAHGNLNPEQTRTIRFSATGAGCLAGEPESETEMGVASTLIRLPSKQGATKVEAVTSDGLRGVMQIRNASE